MLVVNILTESPQIETVRLLYNIQSRVKQVVEARVTCGSWIEISSPEVICIPQSDVIPIFWNEEICPFPLAQSIKRKWCSTVSEVWSVSNFPSRRNRWIGKRSSNWNLPIQIERIYQPIQLTDLMVYPIWSHTEIKRCREVNADSPLFLRDGYRHSWGSL